MIPERTDREALMEKEITMEELVRMVNESEGEFVIHVELVKECDTDEQKESVQS